MSFEFGVFSDFITGLLTTISKDILGEADMLLKAAGILLLIRSLYKATVIKLDEREATVFYGFAIAGPESTEKDILLHTNRIRRTVSLKPLNKQELGNSLFKLAEIKSVERVKGTHNFWRIIEQHIVKQQERMIMSFLRKLLSSRQKEPSQREIELPLESFLYNDDWRKAKKVVKAHTAVLSTDAADKLLAALILKNAKDIHKVKGLAERRELLRNCREQGIEAAFSILTELDKMPSNLATFLQSLNNPTNNLERSHLIENCRKGLNWAAFTLNGWSE